MGSWEFRATRTGWVAHLDAAERAAVLDVVDDVVELLGADDAPVPFGAEPADAGWPGMLIDHGPVAAPSDPALRRLLPDASRAAPDVAAEFRRLTEAELRGTKAGNLQVLRSLLAADVPGLRVQPSSAPAVAAALTDLRLVLAERLGIRSEADAEAAYRLVVEGGPLDVTDPDGVARRFLATVSTLLGVLQESLVGLMLERLPGDDPVPGGPPGDDRHDGSAGPGTGDAR